MTYELIKGSAHHLPMIKDRSVQLICTSPPYFGLRSYSGDQAVEFQTVEYSPMPGLAPITIQGCEPGCEHVWADGKTIRTGREDGGRRVSDHAMLDSWKETKAETTTQGAYCIHCGGWRGGLGLEPTIEAYIGHLILCLREWRRVLRDDGLCFVNLGDSYASDATGSRKPNDLSFFEYQAENGKRPSKTGLGLKPKNLLQIPARFALAAQADGWYLRSAMPWLKRNGMPESATDRPSQVVESVFMLAKSERYFFDMEAVKQTTSPLSHYGGTYNQDHKLNRNGVGAPQGSFVSGFKVEKDESGRNLRSSDLFFRTWQGLLSNDEGDPLALVVNPQPFSAAHFAVFPPLLPEVFILAATSAKGKCPKCGAAWRRVVERYGGDVEAYQRPKHLQSSKSTISLSGKGSEEWAERGTKTVTTGWAPSCSCDAGEHTEIECVDCRGTGCDWQWMTTAPPMTNEEHLIEAPLHPCQACNGTGKRLMDVIPCVVLDPFHGSGTTGHVAARLGRSYIGVDLAEEYLNDITAERMGDGVQMEICY